MADRHGAIDLNAGSSPFTQQDLDDLAKLGEDAGTKATDGPHGTGVVALFAVVITENGVAVGIPNIADAMRQFHGRPASVAEMQYACRHVADEIGYSRVAQHLITTQMQAASAMQRAMADKQLADKLGLHKR